MLVYEVVFYLYNNLIHVALFCFGCIWRETGKLKVHSIVEILLPDFTFP